jgi:hypothetical protein
MQSSNHRCVTSSTVSVASHGGAVAHEMPDQRDHGHNQQRMDQSAGDVKHDPAEDPADQEYEKEREKHDDLPWPQNGGGSSDFGEQAARHAL